MVNGVGVVLANVIVIPQEIAKLKTECGRLKRKFENGSSSSVPAATVAVPKKRGMASAGPSGKPLGLRN